MAERPIIFSGPMVLAILAGRKTQTRRPVKPGATKCPYGSPGDALWVRETWRCRKLPDCQQEIDYKADHYDSWHYQWRPSIFMARAASRIKLRITGIRKERLQEISDANAVAEGVLPFEARSGFMELWDRIYATKGQGWDTNPRVWVITFERIVEE